MRKKVFNFVKNIFYSLQENPRLIFLYSLPNYAVLTGAILAFAYYTFTGTRNQKVTQQELKEIESDPLIETTSLPIRKETV